MSDRPWLRSIENLSRADWHHQLVDPAAGQLLNGSAETLAHALLSAVPSSLRDLIGTATSLAAALERARHPTAAGTRVQAAPRDEHQKARVLDKTKGAFDGSLQVFLGALDQPLFDWRFGGLLAESGGMKTTRDQLVKVASGKDQVAAYGQFEFAREAFRKGRIDDVLEGLSKAVEGPGGNAKGHPDEWRFPYLRALSLLGLLPHPREDHIDVVEAGVSFITAAELARKPLPADAARALLAASWAEVLQWQAGPEVRDRALVHCDEAAKLDPQLWEAVYQGARLRMALGRVDEAMPLLERLAARSGLYLVKAMADEDFQRHAGRLEPMLRKLRDELAAKAAPLVLPLAEKVRPLMAESDILARMPAAARIITTADHMESVGLLDLWGYIPDGVNADRQLLETVRVTLRRVTLEDWDEAVVERVATGRFEDVPTGEVQRIETGEMETVEEPADEEYEEEVIVQKRNPWLFRKEIRKTVKRKRKVMIKRVRERIEERPITERREIFEEAHKSVHHTGREKVTWAIASGVELIAQLETSVVTIEPGIFLMGGPATDTESAEDEKPQHEVVISRPFELWNAPITQEMYEALMGVNPSHFKKGGNYPVEYITFYDAILFCNALSRSRGLPEAYVIEDTQVHWHGLNHPGWRLPTEAEWEYACRAGSHGPRYGELDEIAWHEGNAGKATRPVMEKQPNDWGLYDMLGNVWEWVWDWKSAYDHHTVSDPIGPATGFTRIFRGGSWSHVTRRPRAAVRNDIGPGFRYSYLGFRPARTVLDRPIVEFSGDTEEQGESS